MKKIEEEKPQKGTELMKNEKVEGTPFHITGNDEEGYFLRIGAYKLTEKLPTIDEVYDEIAETPWDITFKLISTMIEINEKYLKDRTTAMDNFTDKQ